MPPNVSVIQHKLEQLDRYLQALRQLQGRTLEELQRETSIAWAVEHGLQICIQCIVDVCQHLVAGLALGSPTSSIAAIDMLEAAGVFPATFAQTLRGMVRFRNVIVHAYAQVDLCIVHAALTGHLDDFVRFAREVSELLAAQDRDHS